MAVIVGTPTGLQRDLYSTTRPTFATDAEGNQTGTYAVQLATAWGSWGSPSLKDATVAAQRNVDVDAVVATALSNDIKVNDRMVIRGDTYTVVSVEDVRWHQRIHVRRVSSAL